MNKLKSNTNSVGYTAFNDSHQESFSVTNLAENSGLRDAFPRDMSESFNVPKGKRVLKITNSVDAREYTFVISEKNSQRVNDLLNKDESALEAVLFALRKYEVSASMGDYQSRLHEAGALTRETMSILDFLTNQDLVSVRVIPQDYTRIMKQPTQKDFTLSDEEEEKEEDEMNVRKIHELVAELDIQAENTKDPSVQMELMEAAEALLESIDEPSDDDANTDEDIDMEYASESMDEPIGDEDDSDDSDDECGEKEEPDLVSRMDSLTEDIAASSYIDEDTIYDMEIAAEKVSALFYS